MQDWGAPPPRILSVALGEIATAMLRKHESDLGAVLLKLGWVGNDVFDDQTSCCLRERSVATDRDYYRII